MLKKRLVLVGGGHAHALVLRLFARMPEPGLEIILVSPVSQAPYSGMLPGCVAGIYAADEIHIDLIGLCQAAGAVFIKDSVKGIDLQSRQIQLVGRPSLVFDCLSLNLGSTPEILSTPKTSVFAIPVKPVDAFLKHWMAFQKSLQENLDKSSSLLIVGGGAGGVELALAMHEASKGKLEITLVQRSSQLLPTHNKSAQKLVKKALTHRGIKLELGQAAVRIDEQMLELADGRRLGFDTLYWATGASAPEWLQTSQLSLDERGFLLIDERLVCLGQQGIFAAGDCASFERKPRPKSGVFAVRQGRPLFENIRRFLRGQTPQPYRFQTHFLSLISTADGSAIASRGVFAWQSQLLWLWKNQIDRRFMSRFSKQSLAKMRSPMPSMNSTNEPMRCDGCAAKLGSGVLTQALQRLASEYPDLMQGEGIVWGLDAREDAAAFRLPPEQTLLQSIDYFPFLLSDPFIMGRIACNHAFSDIFAKGARPHSALLLAVIKTAVDHLAADHLYQVVAGVARQLRLFKATLLGGHSVEGEKMAIGLSVNGLSHGAGLSKRGAKVGDLLILTKAIGTGLIFVGASQGLSHPAWIEAGIASMLLDNGAPIQLALDYELHAATDVTGFGLLGHLGEMLDGTELGVELWWSTIPFLPGARELASRGLGSSLLPANLQAAGAWTLAGALPNSWASVLCDPQTSGGLLLSVAESQAQELLSALRSSAAPDACVIGRITAQTAQKSLYF